MRAHNDEKRIDTTLGELIETVSEIAFEYCEDLREAYTLAGLVLGEILMNSYPSTEGFSGTLSQMFPRNNCFH